MVAGLGSSASQLSFSAIIEAAVTTPIVGIALQIKHSIEFFPHGIYADPNYWNGS